MKQHKPADDVVITGLGLVTPLGNDVATVWQNVLAGQSGIRAITHFDASRLRTQIAGVIRELDTAPFIAPKELRRVDPFVHYALVAGGQAMQQAGLADDLNELDLTRCGVVFGSGIGGLSMIQQAADTVTGQGRMSPFFVPGTIINMAAGMLAIRYGFQGANLATVTACASSTHALGIAARLIAYGDVDLMLCGGSEHTATPLGIGGFAAMQALSARNDAPTQASRPFDRQRDGFVLSDGAGALVLERRSHAVARGAPILAVLSGFGMSDDASHITAAPEDGRGAQLAMRHALRDADLMPEAIQYINAHGTSTPIGDLAEAHAIEAVFGANSVPVSSTKSMTGHMLGAAGAVEAIFCVKALQEQTAPPTINLDEPDPACRLNHVANQARSVHLEHVMSNSFGFGGTNACLILSQA